MKDCYKCGLPSSCLSFRSRCVNCEYESNLFNEKENEKLRAQECPTQETLVDIIKEQEATIAALQALELMVKGYQANEQSTAPLYKQIAALKEELSEELRRHDRTYAAMDEYRHAYIPLKAEVAEQFRICGEYSLANDKLQAELAQWKKTAQEWRRVARLALEVKS